MGNPLLDISAVVPTEFCEKYVTQNDAAKAVLILLEGMD